MFATNLLEPTFQFAGNSMRDICPCSGDEHELVAKRGRDRSSGFEQRFEMRLGRLLKAQRGFSAIATVSVAAGKKLGLGNPHVVFVLTQLDFRARHDHGQRIRVAFVWVNAAEQVVSRTGEV